MYSALGRNLLFVALVFIASKAMAQVTSDFSTNDDGWTAPFASGGTINYNAAGGNPTGNVSALAFNIPLGATFYYVYFYFHAPVKFTGNRSTYLNGTLLFDLQQSSAGTSLPMAEVIIGNTTDSLFYFPGTPFSPAATTWTNYQVVLNASAGFWKTTNSSTGTAATNANISAILSNLQVLEIRGRFRDVTTTGRLDNVNLLPPITINTQPTSTAVCESFTATLTTAASNNASISYHWQKLTASVWNDLVNGSGYSTVTTASMNVNTTGSIGAGSYRCRISGTGALDVFTSVVTITVNTRPTVPGVTNNSACAPGNITLTASGGTAGQYRWYTLATGGGAITGQTASTYSPSFTTTTTYYVAINNGTCTSNRSAVTGTINTPPSAPTTTGASSCFATSLSLTAGGGSAGQYRWYTLASGGTAIAGQTSNIYATPSISTTTTYYAAINNGTCESNRSAVIATITTPPNAPTTTGNFTCTTSTSVTLTAAGGTNGQYRWYTAATGGTAMTNETSATYTTSISATTTYYVAINNGICESNRAAVTATLGGPSCPSNEPPVITPSPITAPIEGKVTLNLATLVSDKDGNLDLSTLKVTVTPTSGAIATIDNKSNLVLDYTGISFSGTEKLTIEVCDLAGACTQRELSIEVIGDVKIYNAISPNNDGKNEFLFLQYIDVLADTKKNKVTIFGRWGDVVFAVDDYNNTSKIFKGLNNSGNELPSGTYFYKIEFTSSHKPLTGYLTLKR